jgi:hypothetical protein
MSGLHTGYMQLGGQQVFIHQNDAESYPFITHITALLQVCSSFFLSDIPDRNQTHIIRVHIILPTDYLICSKRLPPPDNESSSIDEIITELFTPVKIEIKMIGLEKREKRRT